MIEKRLKEASAILNAMSKLEKSGSEKRNYLNMALIKVDQVLSDIERGEYDETIMSLVDKFTHTGVMPGEELLLQKNDLIVVRRHNTLCVFNVEKAQRSLIGQVEDGPLGLEKIEKIFKQNESKKP